MRERGEKRPELHRWAEAAAHNAPSHTAETRLSDRLYSGVKATWVPCSLSPHPQNPTWVGLVLHLPLMVCCPSHMDTQRSGAPEPAGRQHPSSTLWGRQVSSESCPLWGSSCKGQEGPWCAISGERDPTAFPFQRALFEGWGQDGGHSSQAATSSSWEGVGTSADTPGLKRLKKEPKGLEGAKQFPRRL